MRLGDAYVMSFPSIPQYPLSPQTSPSTVIYAFISLANEVNLRSYNQDQNNLAELERVQKTSHTLTGSDFNMEVIVFHQRIFSTGGLHPNMWKDQKYTFFSQSLGKKFSLLMGQHYFFFVALFPSPFLGFPFPRSFFRRICSSLKS